MLITISFLSSFENCKNDSFWSVLKMFPFDQFLQELSFLKKARLGIEQQLRWQINSAGVRLQYSSEPQKYFSILFWSLGFLKMFTLLWFGIKPWPRKYVYTNNWYVFRLGPLLIFFSSWLWNKDNYSFLCSSFQNSIQASRKKVYITSCVTCQDLRFFLFFFTNFVVYCFLKQHCSVSIH